MNDHSVGLLQRQVYTAPFVEINSMVLVQQIILPPYFVFSTRVHFMKIPNETDKIICH